MKAIYFLLFLAIRIQLNAQDVEKIEIPAGVVYKYCKATVYEEAKRLVTEELSDKPDYSLCDNITFIGPVLWARFEKIEALNSIEGGKVTLHVDNKIMMGKMTQDVDDTKKVWDAVRKEVNGKDYVIRKATQKELIYYWSVISFDIEEPLLIVETKEHKYIINLSPKTMKLLWLDEVPN
ncbi:hypothetical protein BH10BAC1_BH10BAC1_16840 [soil metagenome]